MIQVENLSVAYGSNMVFENISTKFIPGKITGIIGPNGAGKSTLIKAMIGMIKSQQGFVKYKDRNLATLKQDIAYVEQRKDIDLTFPISVYEVVLSGSYGRLGLFKDPTKIDKQEALQALDRVELTKFKDRQIGSLSGGQLQRVFVARAILQHANIVILDEPFVGIDMQSEHQIMEILREWKNEGKTIIVIHHDLNKVRTYFDNLLILNHGVVDHGPVDEVYISENIQKAFSADLSEVLFEKEGE